MLDFVLFLDLNVGKCAGIQETLPGTKEIVHGTQKRSLASKKHSIVPRRHFLSTGKRSLAPETISGM